MGVWAVAIVDSGVTNETEAIYGANLYEYNYYYGGSQTDGGRASSHGSSVATSIELTNSALERVDMQISNNTESSLSTSAISNALTQVAALDDAGWSIGAINMSWGSSYSSWVSAFQSQITLLAARGIYSVAASGNYGSHSGLESATYPARLSNVISVGSHDGSGNPTSFSNNGSTVHILADGEDFPSSGLNGTSFAAPQVAATVTTIQALNQSVTGDRLTFDEVIDALQQGGHGARSNPDPADGTTTYFLYDHGGTVNYTLSTHIDSAFSGLEYIASYGDIEAAFGQDASAARSHLLDIGVYEGRSVGFDALEYLASYDDLRGVFGTNREAAASHYLNNGRYEGRSSTFDPDAYMSANPDVASAVGYNDDGATLHYLTSGWAEGRSTSGDAPAVVVRSAVSEGSSDLPTNTSTTGYVGVGQSVTGRIGYWGDRDWYETEFTAGQTVVIQARGSASGGGSLYDPEVYVRNSSGTAVAYNWDSGAGRDAYLAYTPTTSGTYYLDVDGYWFYTGSYTLEVSSASTASLSALADGADLLDRAPESGSPETSSAWLDGMEQQVQLIGASAAADDPFALT